MLGLPPYFFSRGNLHRRGQVQPEPRVLGGILDATRRAPEARVFGTLGRTFYFNSIVDLPSLSFEI